MLVMSTRHEAAHDVIFFQTPVTFLLLGPDAITHYNFQCHLLTVQRTGELLHALIQSLTNLGSQIQYVCHVCL